MLFKWCVNFLRESGRKLRWTILLEKLTKLVQLTELHAAVVLAVREHTKTFRRSKSSFVARKVNWERTKSPREIARETGMSHSSVRHIVKKDLNLKTSRRRVDELLGTDQPVIDRQSNRPVAGQNFIGDLGQRRAYWSTFELRPPCDMSEKHSFRWLQNLGYFKLLLRHFTYAYLFAYFSQNNWVAWISL